MKVLTATNDTQGQRKNDFAGTEEGELVIFGFECSRETVHGRCGCKRSMSGLTTLSATTTIKVRDIPDQTESMMVDKIKSHLMTYWHFTGQAAQDTAKKDAAELIRLASSFQAGDVLERRGRRSLRVRRTLAALNESPALKVYDEQELGPQAR